MTDQPTPPSRPPDRPRWWNATDVIAIIIATTLSISALIIVTAAAFTPDPLSDVALEMMGHIGQVLAGALAAYLGIRYRDK